MPKINEHNTNKVRKPCVLSLPMLCAVCSFASTTHASSTSFTGASGLITTPNALVAETGLFSWQYNNYIEERLEDEFRTSGNYIFTLGVYPRFEIAGRLTDYASVGERYSQSGTLRGKRDLSANVKFNFFKLSNSLSISVGGKDIAGLAQNFTSVYGVASAKWKSSLFSLGVAGGDNDSFEGIFGSARYEFNQHLKFALEVDTQSSINGGVVATLPIGSDLELDATVVAVNGEARAGLTARFKLGKRPYREAIGNDLSNPPVESTVSENISSSRDLYVKEKPSAALAKYSSVLAESGLMNVRVGVLAENHFVVEFENRFFKYSDYDSLAVVIHNAQKILPANSKIDTVLLENGIVKYRDSLNLQGSITRHDDQRRRMVEQERSNIAWVVPKKSKKRSVADFFVEPALVSAVGTEFGTIDYSLAARLGVSVPLWRGARAIVSSYIPIHNSRNFETGNPYSGRAFDQSLERAMLVQYFQMPKRIHSQVELGQVQLNGFDYNAFKVQGAWQSSHWPIRLHARFGQYDLIDTDLSRDVYLGSISYTASRWDTVFTATYGQFFFGENAFRLDVTKRFGTTHIGLFAKFLAEDDIAGGMKVSLPIGPRKSWQWQRLSFSGSSRWSHALQTTVKFPNVSDNRLQPALLFEPLVDTEIPNRILDYGRLNPFDFSRQSSLINDNKNLY